MLTIVGFVVVLVCVIVGYSLAGGKFGVIIKALPFEMMIIGGSGIGAMIMANSPVVLKGVVGGIKQILSGPKWKKQDYVALLSLMYQLTKLMKSKGVLAVEAHIENPKDSAIFQAYPKILHDHFAVPFLCDTMRMMAMNLEDPHQIYEAMEAQLEKHHHENARPADALQTLADALPALGIVAAVLGVIKTMSSVTEPPEVLGGMVASALVGTFLGVFLSYGMSGPMAARLKQIIEEDHQFFMIIRDVLVAHLNGNAPQVSIEIGRGQVPTSIQPSFSEMEQALASAE